MGIGNGMDDVLISKNKCREMDRFRGFIDNFNFVVYNRLSYSVLGDYPDTHAHMREML